MLKFTLWGLYQYDPTIFNNAPVPDGIDKQMLIDTIMDNSGDLYCYYQQPARFKLSVTNWFRRHEHGIARMLLALTKEYDPLENYDRIETEDITPKLTREKTASGSDVNTLSGSDVNTQGGKDTTQLSGTDSNTASGNDKVTTDMTEDTDNELKTSAFDSSTYENKNHTDNTVDTDGTVTTDYGRIDTTSYGRKDETTYGRTDSTTYGRQDTTAYGRKDIETENGNTHRQLRAHGNIGTTQSTEMLLNELNARRFDLYKAIAQMFEDDLLIQVY